MTDILVLEDEQTAREALVKILENCSPDIRVRAAATLEEARRLLAENRTYGLFLLDVNLSGNDREDIGGILFAREVREQFRYSFTPSSWSQPSAPWRCRHTGNSTATST